MVALVEDDGSQNRRASAWPSSSDDDGLRDMTERVPADLILFSVRMLLMWPGLPPRD